MPRNTGRPGKYATVGNPTMGTANDIVVLQRTRMRSQTDDVVVGVPEVQLPREQQKRQLAVGVLLIDLRASAHH